MAMTPSLKRSIFSSRSCRCAALACKTIGRVREVRGARGPLSTLGPHMGGITLTPNLVLAVSCDARSIGVTTQYMSMNLGFVGIV
jgi:hypothetical protein